MPQFASNAFQLLHFNQNAALHLDITVYKFSIFDLDLKIGLHFQSNNEKLFSVVGPIVKKGKKKKRSYFYYK